MTQRIARWLRQQPAWARYLAGYLLIVLLLLAVVEYRGRPAAKALSATPASHAAAHHAAPARHPAPVRHQRAPISPLVNPSAGNPPAPPAPRAAASPSMSHVPGGAHAAHVRPLALHLICRGGAAPHLVLGVPTPLAIAHTGAGVAWDLGPLGRADRIQFTIDAVGCR